MNNLANVEENDENTLGHAADLSRLLRSWKCWAHPLRRLLVGIRVVPVGPSLVPSDVPPRREGVVIQGTLMEILTDFGTEFLLIGEGGGGTNFAAMRCMFKSDIRIACTVPDDIPTMAAMSLMDPRRYSCTRRRIVSTFSRVKLVVGRPDLLTSSSDVLPLMKRVCHSKHLARLIAIRMTNHVKMMKSQMCPRTWSQTFP